MRRPITFVTLACFVAVHSPGHAGPHEEGVAAGNAAITSVRPKVNPTDATANVPGYSTTPQQSSLYGKPNLGSEAAARVNACAMGTGSADPTCQGITTAVGSANTPRPSIGPYDPAVAAARGITANPAATLGGLSAYYSGCTTSAAVVGAGTRPQSCLRYVGAGNFSCARRLSVAVELTPNCSPGTWIAHAESGITGIDVQCIPNRRDTSHHFRVTSNGAEVKIFDADMTTAARLPIPVATVATTFGMDGSAINVQVWMVDNLCTGDTCTLSALVAPDRIETTCNGNLQDGISCSYQYPFIYQYGACPAGTQSGDNIVLSACSGQDGCTSTSLDPSKCYAPSPTGSFFGTDITGQVPGTLWDAASQRDITGWSRNPAVGFVPMMSLTYTKPSATITETDTWSDDCPTDTAGSRCAAASAALCTDGPSTKRIDGVDVGRPCWSYQSTYACAAGAPLDQCAPLAAAGCSASASTCRQVNALTGVCDVYEDIYQCPTDATTRTAVACPRDVFCLGSSCFNIGSVNDPDFGRSVSMIEGAREAGIYLDTDHMRLFIGAPSSCSLSFDPLGVMLNANCCKPDSDYGGYSNQSLFGGSTYMYDSLFTMDNAKFIYQAIGAMVAGEEVNGSFSAFGVTYTSGAEGVAAVEASYASGEASGVVYVAESGEWAVSFDPWSLVVMIIVMLIIDEISCDPPEEIHNLRAAAGLCHQVGEYCVRHHLLDHTRQCRKLNRSFCCFNSMLSRIINEQGRPQIGKGWGDPKGPDCTGFTVAELQRLDFGAMDFSEFYASIVPTLPNAVSISTGAASRAPNCYYGQGSCR